MKSIIDVRMDIHKKTYSLGYMTAFGLVFLILPGCTTASPSISHLNCWGVISLVSDSSLGHLILPFSSLL